MNKSVASFRLSEIILHALDLGFTGIEIDRAPGLFGEHVIRLGLPDLPGVIGVVTISASGLAGDDGRLTADAIKAEMSWTLLPTMRLVAMVEAHWRQMEKLVAGMLQPSADSDWWTIGPMPLSAPAPKALPSPAKAPPVQTWPVATVAELAALAALERAAFPLRTYQFSDPPPKPKAPPVETLKVKVDVDNLDELRELERAIRSVGDAYDDAADSAERLNVARAEFDAATRAEFDEATRADMAFLTEILAEGTDHQRTTYETLREAGVPIYEIATSFRSAFDSEGC